MLKGEEEFCLIWKSGLFFLPISQLHNTSYVYFATQGTCNRLVGSFKNSVPEHFDAVLLLPDWLVHSRCKHLWLMWLSVPTRTRMCVCFWRGLDLASANLWCSPDVMEVAAVSIRPLARRACRAESPPPTHAWQTSVNILACPASSQNQRLNSAKRPSHGCIISTGYQNGNMVAWRFFNFNFSNTSFELQWHDGKWHHCTFYGPINAEVKNFSEVYAGWAFKWMGHNVGLWGSGLSLWRGQPSFVHNTHTQIRELMSPLLYCIKKKKKVQKLCRKLTIENGRKTVNTHCMWWRGPSLEGRRWMLKQEVNPHMKTRKWNYGRTLFF